MPAKEREPRPGHNEGMREMGRRAASNSLPIEHIDQPCDMFTASDRWHWKAGWRQEKRKQIGLHVVRESDPA